MFEKTIELPKCSITSWEECFDRYTYFSTIYDEILHGRRKAILDQRTQLRAKVIEAKLDSLKEENLWQYKPLLLNRFVEIDKLFHSLAHKLPVVSLNCLSVTSEEGRFYWDNHYPRFYSQSSLVYFYDGERSLHTLDDLARLEQPDLRSVFLVYEL